MIVSIFLAYVTDSTIFFYNLAPIFLWPALSVISWRCFLILLFVGLRQYFRTSSSFSGLSQHHSFDRFLNKTSVHLPTAGNSGALSANATLEWMMFGSHCTCLYGTRFCQWFVMSRAVIVAFAWNNTAGMLTGPRSTRPRTENAKPNISS